MKYRIKIVTYKNGRKEFFPYVKNGLFWKSLNCRGEAEFLFFVPYSRDSREGALKNIDAHYAGNSKKQSIEFEYINK